MTTGSRLVRSAAAAVGTLLLAGLAACSMPSGNGGASPTGPASPPLTPTSAPSSAPSSPDTSPSTPVSGAAAAHCRQTGGTVQLRQPTFNTNEDESTWVELGDPIEVCRYQEGEGENNSRIYADLVTLYSTKPTLAALAYLAKKTPPSQSTDANPATIYCSYLQGTSEFGTSLAGGGLVAEADPDDPVFSPCMFADGSFIDQWGIAYHSVGDIRGKDLTTVFRFDTKNLPPVFAG